MSYIPAYHYDEGIELYVLDELYTYYSKRYDKFVYLKEGYTSDGATGAIDIKSASWWVHDKLCEDMAWGDGTPCTRWQGSNVIADILKSEGRWIRDGWWKYATYTPKIWNQFKSWF